jgi:hypothetical protein
MRLAERYACNTRKGLRLPVLVVWGLRCTGGMLERFTPDTGYPSRSRDFTIPAALCEKNDENEEYD